MSGTHKFTSSIWIQSGSAPATFQSGISVTGNVTATRFVGDGSGITGLGTAVFFAGSGSGISASSPTSVDHVTELDASDAVAPVDYFRIETTSSAGFKPNHFVFIKLTDRFETLQAGSQDFYAGVDRTPGSDLTGEQPFTNDLAPGVHRYIVYATNTGSAGETHAVYTSAFIKGYVNVEPTIVAPLQTDGVVQIAHDSNILTHILRFTGSFEPNAAANDFIRVFSASRSTNDPTTPSETTATYDLTMQHHQSDISDSDNLIATGSVDPGNPYLNARGVYGAGPGNTAALPNSALVFTASISDYNVTDGTTIYAESIEPYEERFKITMFDNWYVDHSSSLEYSMSIVPPNTASIQPGTVNIEAGSYTGKADNSHTTTVLYDDPGVTRTDKNGLHDRYTASLVRISVTSDITEPEDYEPDGTHFTDIKLYTFGTSNNILNDKTFRFSGSMIGPGQFRATASAYGDSFDFTNVTESLGYTPFEFTPGTTFMKIRGGNTTNELRHGNYNHISPIPNGTQTQLIVNSVPNIEISRVRVEVESGSFLTGVGAFERSASVLYGFTSSLRVAETSSLEGYEKSAEYISESVVRVRLLTTVTEPFGPHHTKMVSTLETHDSSYAHSHVFEFHTGSADTASSVIAYDDQNRLVGNYTSSWINFNLLPGEYVFSASFDSNTNAGRTITPGTYAEVSVSNTPATEITNIRYETETSGYSEEPSIDAMRTVLYGVPRHTLVDSSSFEGHDNAVSYASHSVSRFRVLADIREPFGPHHTASMFEKVWTNNVDGQSFTSVIHFSTGSTDTASSAIAYDSANRLSARYTSSWIGRQLSSSDDASKTWTYTSGSITHTPNDLSGFVTSSGHSTQLKVNDTAKTHLSNRIYEFEEYGHSASSAADSGVTSTIRTVLYGNSHHTLIDSSSLNELPESRRTAYASQSVSRARLRVRVTEPVGPGIGSVHIKRNWNGIISDGVNAYTNSADFESISHGYDSQKRLVAHYTQSWIGQQLDGYTAFAQFGYNEFTTRISSWEEDISSSLESVGENGLTGTLSSDETTADLIVRNTAPTEITNVRYETETFGYSGEPSIDTTRKVLYGVPHYTTLNSASFELHDSASLYASQSVTRFRVLATVTEPVGPLHTASMFERVWSSPLQDTLKDIIYFSTASGDVTASSAIAYDSSNRYVAHYTSSWMSQSLSSSNYTVGEEWKYTSGSILHEPVGENGFITSSGKSTTITVFDTQPTVFSNFKTETETHGYSNEPTQNAMRSVLYGVAHKTVVDSSSFEGHDNAASYASQSVSQFRIVARITEPVGPLQHTPSVIEKRFHYGQLTFPGKTERITFSTASTGFESSRSFFTEVGEFVTEYTTSFEGKELEVQPGPLAERIWSISTGSVTHNPAGENSANSSSFTATSLKVRNTDSVKIEKIFWETETHGYSNEETSQGLRTVLYGNARVTDIDSSSYENHVNSGSYASHSVSRIRFRARITEPHGPAVNPFTASFTHGSDISHFVIHTGSIEDGGNVSYEYVDNRLVAHYTSSYSGSEFDTIASSEKTHDLTGTFVEIASGENGLVESDETNGSITVRDTEPTQINNIYYETETFGYSGISSRDTTRTVLYGDKEVTNTGTGSGDTGESWESHDSASLYASQSVTRFRIQAQITEPVGPLHTASRFEKVWSATGRSFSDVIHFSTASGDITASSVIAYDASNRLVSQYTSQWIGKGLSSSIYYAPTLGISGEMYTYTSGSILHEPTGETGFVTASGESTTITVFDTQPTEYSDISLETETYGYSGIPAPSSSRKVLYGVPHHTLATTQSLDWADPVTGHDSASLYASQSVTRFRIYTKITEPVGHLQTGSIIRQQFAPGITNTIQEIANILTPGVATITSTQLAGGAVNQAFDNSDSVAYQALADEKLTIVFNNPQIVSKMVIGTEEELNNIKVFASPDSGNTYIEQVGIQDDGFNPTRAYTHFKIEFNNDIQISITEIDLYEPEYSQPIVYHDTVFRLNADDGVVESSHSFYDEQSRHVSVYTSSYFGVQLSSSNTTTGEQWQHSVSQIIHTPGDNSITKQIHEASASEMRVYDTKGPKYTAVTTTTETYGYSGVTTRDTLRTVLYGKAGITDIDSASYESHPSASIYASHSVSRFRLSTRITEPVGPLQHTASNVAMMFDYGGNFPTFFGKDDEHVYHSHSIVLSTESIAHVKSYWTPVGEYVSEYTSSWVSQSLSSSATFTNWFIGTGDHAVKHQYPGENLPAALRHLSTAMRVNNTAPTQIDSIAYETETHGYSGIPSFNTARKVLYGDVGATNANSASFEDHDHVVAYASHSVSRFRVRARVTEPVGPLHTASRFEQVWDATDETAITDALHFSTASNNVVSKSYSDTAGRFVVEYTTSFEGKALAAPNATTREWNYKPGSIVHEPYGEPAANVASGDLSIVTVDGTPNTRIENVRIETETYGHSSTGIQNTNELTVYAISRSILYGDTTTNADSASFEGLNSIFAEKSVTRFRVLADIVEPLGPHHTGSMFAYTKANSGDLTIGKGDSEFIIFSTASVQTASSNIAYNTSTKELEAAYTSSWFGESLSPSRVLSDGTWHINITDGNILHTPIDNSGVNKNTSEANLYMVVSASKPIEVSAKFRTETFYSSSVNTNYRTETILYGFNRTLTAADANTIGDIWSGSAAIRLQPTVTITEPLGFRHFTTDVTMSTANRSHERAYKFHTASLETQSRSERVLNSEGRFVTSYTGSYEDNFTFTAPGWFFNPRTEYMTTGSDVTGIYMHPNGIKRIQAAGSATIIVDPAPATQITNVRIEAETVSGSAEGTDSRTTTILHGNTVTETDKAANAGYPNATARQQLTSVRLLADIAEPFGPHHTASIFTIQNTEGDTYTVRLHTGSADVAETSKQMYDTHGSTTVAYTSSFVPAQLSAGTIEYSVPAANITHEFENNKTTSERTHATITVEDAPAASVFVLPQTGSNNWSGSKSGPHIQNEYIAYNKAGDMTQELISGISASAPTETSESVLQFPDHLNVQYKAGLSSFKFQNDTYIFNGTNSSEDTASLTIPDSYLNTLTFPANQNIKIKGRNILSGNGESTEAVFYFNIIPAKPQNMDGMYWGGSFEGHNKTGIEYGAPGISVPSIDSNRRLYTGRLSKGLVYKSGDTAGTQVTNIVMAKDSVTGPANYSMSFTPNAVADTGNYNTVDRLFDRGDQGNLIVRVNGARVVDYNLAGNFKPINKNQSQDIAGITDPGNIDPYDGNGTASFADIDGDASGLLYIDTGRLILTQVKVFNNTGDFGFTTQGVHYTHGYQGWSARIEIDNKLRNGYNKLEFSHSFDDGTSQNCQPFEWYYDDNINKAKTRATANASYTDTGNETIALSGVKYFKDNTNISMLLEDAIVGIAGPTYPSTGIDVIRTTPGPGITIKGVDDIFSETGGEVNHNLDTYTGLYFDEVGEITASVNASASFEFIAKASEITTTGEYGETKYISLKETQRGYGSSDSFELGSDTNTTINLGRFVDAANRVAGQETTDTTEDFTDEDYRWLHTDMGTAQANQNDPGGIGNTGPADTKLNFEYWLDKTSTSFNSEADISDLQELQVTASGSLLYPREDLSANNLPNSVNYANATEYDARYFYRAFRITNGNISAIRDFKIIIYYDPADPLTRSDIFAQDIDGKGTSNNIDSTPLRIDIKFPGALTGTNPTPFNAGTGWGSIGGGSGAVSNLRVDDWTSAAGGGESNPQDSFATAGETITKNNVTVTAPANSIMLHIRSGNWNTAFVNGIILARIRMKLEFEKKITKIEIDAFTT